MTETQELLATFVKTGSDSAFRELVTRYFDLVYSTAVRLVDGDTHRAEDVAQLVFADLARTASKLSENSMLGGWLHRHTCFVARTIMRGERRRQVREKLAVEMNALNDKSQGILAQAAPVLDEAINDLGADDREAILLRFFERRPLRLVGEALGMSDNAAQKRVARAVEELRSLLKRRGVSLSAAALAGGLAAEAVTAAPLGLAMSVAGTVLAKAGATGGIGFASAKMALMAKLRLGMVAAAGILGLVAILLLQNQFGWNRPGHPRLSAQGSSQQQNELSPTSAPAASQATGPGSGGPVGDTPDTNVSVAQPSPQVAEINRPVPSSAPLPSQPSPGGVVTSTGRLYPKPGSKLRIEGTSKIHNWQVECPFIGGFLDIGPGFPLERALSVTSSPLWAQGEAFVPVRSLKSVDGSGKLYSDKMDALVWASLRVEQNPKITYRLAELALTSGTNNNGVVQYECESRGELAIAGVTNELTFPVLIIPKGGGKVTISGHTSIRMSSFQIDPPDPQFASGPIYVGDEMNVIFVWVLGPGTGSSQRP